MSSNVDRLREYLVGSEIDRDEKNFTLNFCKRNEYINSLMKQMSSKINGTYIHTGFGNVNSKIAFIFDSYELYSTISSEFRKVLEGYNINIWDLYITYLDKTDINFEEKYLILTNELKAVQPVIAYFVSNDSSIENNITLNTLVEHYTISPELITMNSSKLFGILVHCMKYIE